MSTFTFGTLSIFNGNALLSKVLSISKVWQAISTFT